MANSGPVVEAKLIDVHITHLVKDGPNIKIFAQPGNNTLLSNYVEKILFQSRVKFMEHNVSPKNIKDIALGVTCCAKFEDGVYYRAKVVNLDKLNPHRLVGVHFIDHGNSAEIKVEDIVILSKAMEVVADDQKMGISFLSQTVPLAEEYILHGYNATQGNAGDDAAIATFRDKLCNRDIKCKVYEYKGKKLMQILHHKSDESTSKLNSIRDPNLMRLGDVKHSQLAKLEQPQRLRPNLSMPPPPLSLQQAVPTSRFPNLSQPPPMVQSFKKPGAVAPGMAMKNVRPTTAPMSTAQNLQFSSDMLVPGVTHQVFVSHVEDGPSAFSVQIQVGLRLA